MLKKAILSTFLSSCFLLVCGLILANSDWFWDIVAPVYYEDLVCKYAKNYDIDPLFAAAIIKVESSFYSSAQSPRGAIGLMQIMPSTGKEIASKLKLRPFTVSDLYDPEINIQIGLYYLAKLKKKFNGDLHLTLAAYNGGLSNVKKWLSQKKISLPSSKEDMENIPFKETRQFVQAVMWNYQWLKNADKIRRLLAFRHQK
ncbi:MAG: lytic transglycosylase domain-containing protein [bacterium]|nr:lytic transglycosylase domain-containing protein [bacterium]